MILDIDADQKRIEENMMLAIQQMDDAEIQQELASLKRIITAFAESDCAFCDSTYRIHGHNVDCKNFCLIPNECQTYMHHRIRAENLIATAMDAIYKEIMKRQTK